MDNKLSYEEALKSLEEIVEKLESGKESLTSSLALFEEGTKLCAYCSSILERAEQKITDMSKGEQNEL